MALGSGVYCFGVQGFLEVSEQVLSGSPMLGFPEDCSNGV